MINDLLNENRNIYFELLSTDMSTSNPQEICISSQTLSYIYACVRECLYVNEFVLQ